MRLRQKFMTLAAIMALAIVIVCVISYHFASEELASSVDSELRTTVAKESAQLNGWLETKKAFGVSTANELTSVNGNMALLKSKEILGTITSDKEILEMSIGLEDGYFYCYYAGDITGKLDPTGRLWYKNSQSTDGAVFTEPYVDVEIKSAFKYVLSEKPVFSRLSYRYLKSVDCDWIFGTDIYVSLTCSYRISKIGRAHV